MWTLKKGVGVLYNGGCKEGGIMESGLVKQGITKYSIFALYDHKLCNQL